MHQCRATWESKRGGLQKLVVRHAYDLRVFLSSLCASCLWERLIAKQRKTFMPLLLNSFGEINLACRQWVGDGLVSTIRMVDWAKMQPKKYKMPEINVHLLFYNKYVKLMYINYSPMNIDLDDSPLLTFIFMFLSLFIANISLFIVFSLSIH